VRHQHDAVPYVCDAAQATQQDLDFARRGRVVEVDVEAAAPKGVGHLSNPIAGEKHQGPINPMVLDTG